MHDEFRVEALVEDPSRLLDALRSLEAPEGAGEAQEEGGGRVAITHEDGRVFLYADSQLAGERARELVREAMAQAGLPGELTLWRWHPLEERWEDASVPLPASEAERAAELARRDAQEDAESQAAGYPEWEVRITLPTVADARTLAHRLEGEGIPVVRRFRHLMAGADNEDAAAALAERLRAEAPPGSRVETMGSGGPAVWSVVRGPGGYFAGFGGLGW
jgi:hypothetical protein